MLIPLLALALTPSDLIDPWPELRVVGWWSVDRTDTGHLDAPVDARIIRPAGRGVSVGLHWTLDPRPAERPALDAWAMLDPETLDALGVIDGSPDALAHAWPEDLLDPWLDLDLWPGAGGDDGDGDGEDDDSAELPPPPPNSEPPPRGPRPRPAAGGEVRRHAVTMGGWLARLTAAHRAVATARTPLDATRAQIDLDEARARLALRRAEQADALQRGPR